MVNNEDAREKTRVYQSFQRERAYQIIDEIGKLKYLSDIFTKLRNFIHLLERLNS